MDIGTIGIWTSYRPFGIDRAGEAAKLAEQLGYGAWWVGSSPQAPDIRPILEATSTLVAATGILNVWSNDPGETAAADADLRAEFPGRFMLGIGIGHPEATSDYRRPLTTMRTFLDGLDASPTPPPVDERCLAALGPKMLDLAGERTAGTHTVLRPGRAHALRARAARPRQARGAGGGVRRRHRSGARQGRRPRVREALPRPAQLHAEPARLRLHRGDLADGGSDRLIDAVIPHGSAEQIAEVVRAHLDAGADHVCLQPLGEEGIPRASWTALAKVLID